MAARDAFTFSVTVPAGTPIAAPVTIDTSIPVRRVYAIVWRVPPGAAGLVGFRITSGGQQVVPTKPGTWIVAAGEKELLPIFGQAEGGRWDVTAYNTGVFPHTIRVTYHTEVIERHILPPSRVDDDLLSEFPGIDAAIYLPGMWG